MNAVSQQAQLEDQAAQDVQNQNTQFIPVTVEEAEHLPSPTPPPPQAPSLRLTREEMLEIENLSLKVQNLGMQMERMKNDLLRGNQMVREYQELLQSKRRELTDKYGMDLLDPSTQILPDGTLISTKKPGG